MCAAGPEGKLSVGMDEPGVQRSAVHLRHVLVQEVDGLCQLVGASETFAMRASMTESNVVRTCRCLLLRPCKRDQRSELR